MFEINKIESADRIRSIRALDAATPTPTPTPILDECASVCFRMACPQICIFPTPTPTFGVHSVVILFEKMDVVETPTPTPTISSPTYLCYSNEFCVGYIPSTSTPTPTPTVTPDCGVCEYYFDISDVWTLVTDACSPGCSCVHYSWHEGLCHGSESCTCSLSCESNP
jgi:hypothetical protein